MIFNIFNDKGQSHIAMHLNLNTFEYIGHRALVFVTNTCKINQISQNVTLKVKSQSHISQEQQNDLQSFGFYISTLEHASIGTDMCACIINYMNKM